MAAVSVECVVDGKPLFPSMDRPPEVNQILEISGRRWRITKVIPPEVNRANRHEFPFSDLNVFSVELKEEA
jgi:hypothetical protein